MGDAITKIPLLGQAIEISRDRFQTFNSRGGEVSFSLVENKYGLFAPWAAIILVSGGDYRLTFKVHFTLAQAIRIAINPEESEVATYSGQRIRSKSFDYIKEFCNLYGGSLKRAFSDSGVNLGISLPLLTRGFDEVFFPKADFVNSFEAFWDLTNQLGTIRCSLYIEVLNVENLKKLNIKLDSSDEGEIDFL